MDGNDDDDDDDEGNNDNDQDQDYGEERNEQDEEFDESQQRIWGNYGDHLLEDLHLITGNQEEEGDYAEEAVAAAEQE